ncbi:MAG TPA: glycosyltransferase, partial [Atribacterota bacterium]|nr:glycosyltransferase [Atribacterota bacterium]
SIRLKFHLPMNPIVLYLGRIDKDKSIEVLMKTIPKVIKETNAHFVIAGIGDELPNIKKMAEEMSMEQVIHFLGRVDHQSSDLEEIYQISTVFAIPSAIETQSIVTLEAMAAGLPVVAANAGALPELVKNGENGYLFKPGDSDLMAKDIITILNDEKLREKMKKRSLEIISDHRISQSFEKVQKVYEKVIKKNKK